MKRILSLSLLLCFISGSAQEILTIGEVFDFEIGDEFHYSYYPYSGSESNNASRYLVTDKTISDNGDTVKYGFECEGYIFQRNWNLH